MTGIGTLSPVPWKAFVDTLPETERGDLLGSYMRRLNDPDPAVNEPAALAWSRYEAESSTLYPEDDLVEEMTGPGKALALSRIEAHYFVNKCFLEPGQLMAGVPAIREIPTTIVQGRYDLLCPIVTSEALHAAWPEAEYVLVPDAGHSAFEPSITRELVAATERMKTKLAK